jgi:uncharacterized membrane protein YgdD (TMEM256/DUF423 family)
MTHKYSIAVACGILFLAVALGAFGAHGLKSTFEAQPRLGEIYHTAVHYQMIHGLAILFAGMWAEQHQQKCKSALVFLFGCVVFSGSLYAIVATGMNIFGAITPVGGLAFLVGWLMLAREVLKS